MYLPISAEKPSSRKGMVAFLHEHPRYDTMNSWNRSTSYAHCIKIHRLGLDYDTTQACFEMLDVQEAYLDFSEVLRDFENRHTHRWQIVQNGRSGGYLVLIHGGIGKDGRVFCQPGRSLDMDADFEDWTYEDLSERVELVWDFDQTCEQAVAFFLEFATSHSVAEEEILVPTRVKVAVPRTEG